MPQADIVQIADQIVTELNSGSFSLPFTAERAYLPTYDLPDAGTLKVTVVPKSDEGSLDSRSQSKHDYAIDIGIQQKPATIDNASLDPLKKVHAGEELNIPADAYNAFVDAANAIRNKQQLAQMVARFVRSADIVKVRNQTGGDLDRFSVLGIDVPVILPSANILNFQNAVALDGVAPDETKHRGSFVVLFEPVKAGAIGRAVAAGVSIVQVSVSDADHQFADVSTGVTASLTSSHFGTARIFWKQSGTGLKWAVVRLGHGPTQAGSLRFTLDEDRKASPNPTLATIQDWWGSQEDVQQPTGQLEVHFLGGMFPRALAGAEGIAAYDAANDRYVVTYCDQAALALSATLSGTLRVEDGSASIGSYEAITAPGFGQRPPGIATAANPHHLAGKSGYSCLLLWNHDTQVYDVAQVQHIRWKRALRNLQIKLNRGKLRFDWQENDLCVMACDDEYTMFKVHDLCALDCGSSSSSVSSSSASQSQSSRSVSSESGSPSSSRGSSASESRSASSSTPPSESGSPSESQPPSGSGSSPSGGPKSSAIVPASWSPTGYTALFILEAPEVRFDDVIVATVAQTDGHVAIDPKYLEVCEPGSVEVCGCSADLPVAMGAAVDGPHVRLRFAEQQPDRQLRLVIRLTGIRRGFAGVRLPDRTREQFEANERFINSAYPK